jgi:hypothetical protein
VTPCAQIGYAQNIDAKPRFDQTIFAEFPQSSPIYNDLQLKHTHHSFHSFVFPRPILNLHFHVLSQQINDLHRPTFGVPPLPRRSLGECESQPVSETIQSTTLAIIDLQPVL